MIEDPSRILLHRQRQITYDNHNYELTLGVDHRQYRFQNGLEMEKHPRCSVKTLMHAKNA